MVEKIGKIRYRLVFKFCPVVRKQDKNNNFIIKLPNFGQKMETFARNYNRNIDPPFSFFKL
jgi:hypothetical protein